MRLKCTASWRASGTPSVRRRTLSWPAHTCCSARSNSSSKPMPRRTAQRMVNRLTSRAIAHRLSSCCRESRTSSISSRGSTAICTRRPSARSRTLAPCRPSVNNKRASQASSPSCTAGRGCSSATSQCTRTWRRPWVSRGCRLTGSRAAVSLRYSTTASADCSSRSTSCSA
ncbi:hypothetical protein D9M71_676180 [compost metagenome]